MSCSKTQRSDAGEARTRDPSVTALPIYRYLSMGQEGFIDVQSLVRLLIYGGSSKPSLFAYVIRINIILMNSLQYSAGFVTLQNIGAS